MVVALQGNKEKLKFIRNVGRMLEAHKKVIWKEDGFEESVWKKVWT